jgi:ArsR family transcriptional regulator, lead/cadmium/zinc/bismuth-responsive transcriptional repressor
MVLAGGLYRCRGCEQYSPGESFVYACERSKGAAFRETPDKLCNVPCFKESLVKGLRSKMPPEEVIEETRVLFGALADRARLKILYSLKQAGELCVCDVAHVLGTSVSTASHHLRKLRDLKLLKYRNDGKMSYYSLSDEFAARLVAEALGQAKR